MDIEFLDQIKIAIYSAWDANPDKSKDLTQVAEDIWITDKPIKEHIDSTKLGYLSYCMVLLNELDLVLCEVGESRYLRVGEVFEINARLPHSARVIHRVKKNGLFAALIWDMPETALDKFKSEAKIRIKEWLKISPTLYLGN